MSVIKINRGTPDGSRESLCESCRHATIVEGVTFRERVVYCGELYGMKQDNLPMKVVRCSAYDNKSTPSLRSMELIAWTLQTDAGKKVIGFKPPSKRRDDE